MSIASSALEAVHKELHVHPGNRAAKVGLRIGEYAGVDTASLRFCFEELVKGTEWEPLELEIEWCSAQDTFNYRLAGHAETGRDSFSDPALGGLVTLKG